MAEEVRNKNGVDFDIDAIITDLNGKADKDLANVNISEVFGRKLEEAGINLIIESQVADDGISWYRVWSDGWCEQGGYTQAGNNVPRTLLFKEYKDTSYLIFTQYDADSSSTFNGIIARVDSKGKGFFGLKCGSTVNAYWKTCGYIR